MTDKKKFQRTALLGQSPLVQGFEFFLSRGPTSPDRGAATSPPDRCATRGPDDMLQAGYRNLVDAPVPPHLTRLVELLEQRDVAQPSPRATREDDKA
jgi:hypothetical protein